MFFLQFHSFVVLRIFRDSLQSCIVLPSSGLTKSSVVVSPSTFTKCPLIVLPSLQWFSYQIFSSCLIKSLEVLSRAFTSCHESFAFLFLSFPQFRILMDAVFPYFPQSYQFSLYLLHHPNNLYFSFCRLDEFTEVHLRDKSYATAVTKKLNFPHFRQ